MRKWFGFLGILIFCSSCLDTEVALSGDDYKLIDSLYNDQKDSILPLLDGECHHFRDSVLQIWIDSIMTERLEEIEKLIGQ